MKKTTTKSKSIKKSVTKKTTKKVTPKKTTKKVAPKKTIKKVDTKPTVKKIEPVKEVTKKEVHLIPKKVAIYLLIIGILLALSIILGYTYSIYQIDKIQPVANEITVGCFTINFEDSGTSNSYTNFSLTNSYPIEDEDALALTPYKFKITNVCNYVAKTDIAINVLKTSSISQLATNQGKVIGDMVKVAIQEGTKAVSVPSKLSSFNEGTIRSGDTVTDKSYIIRTDYMDAEESKTYNVWMWVPEEINSTEVENEAQGLTLYAKVDILSTAVDDADTITGDHVAYITNGKDSNLKSLEIKGNTESNNNVAQNGTLNLVVSGKNLFDYRWLASTSTNGLVVTNNNDGTFTINGSKTDTTKPLSYHKNIVKNPSLNIFFDSGYYVASISLCDNNYITSNTIFTYVNHYYNDSTSQTSYPASNTVNRHKIYIDYDEYVNKITNTHIGLYSHASYTPGEGTYCPQLEYGDQETEWEAYKERRYSIELKDTSNNTINGIGSNDTLKKVNGSWVIDNGTTQTELALTTQRALDNIEIYDGVSRIWIDDDVLISNISIEYYAD